MIRFTIRELLLIVMVAGLSLGWIVDHHTLAAENQRISEKCNLAVRMCCDYLARLDELAPGWRESERHF